MEDLIAAVATGPVKSAVGIIRLSGEGAIPCAAKVFKSEHGLGPGTARPRTMVRGKLLDGENRVIDDALAAVFPAPNSYTGEDTVELYCHGSPTVLTLALEALFQHGARQAGAGEFTRRAFLNGKLDLTQAEAVADLIDAESPAAARHAAGQLGGKLSRELEGVYDGLADLLAHFHVLVDYPDEDLEPMDAPQIAGRLETAREKLESLLEGYRRGGRYLRGVPTAIVGPPNAGKSSLLNALLGYDRAIVTDVPGTTRDTVEETCRVGETLLRLTDTAGLRPAADAVERLGVERSRAALEDAALVLLVLDGSEPLSEEGKAALDLVRDRPNVLCLLNKADKPQKIGPGTTGMEEMAVSARTGEGLAALAERIGERFPALAGETVCFTNARQAAAAGEAVRRLEQAARDLAAGMAPDGPLSDVELAMAALGELTGRSVREDVVDRIFSRFCVGK